MGGQGREGKGRGLLHILLGEEVERLQTWSATCCIFLAGLCGRFRRRQPSHLLPRRPLLMDVV